MLRNIAGKVTGNLKNTDKRIVFGDKIKLSDNEKRH